MFVVRATVLAPALVLFLAAACERRVDPTPAPVSAAAAGVCVPDSAPREPDWHYPDQDSVRLVLDSLDRALAQAAHADIAPLLLARGRARTAFMPSAGSVHEAYATAHPDDYHYNEIGADWLYTGTDLRDLIRRFPQSELVDDAAYALTHLPLGGECEGYVACYVATQWSPLSEFLARHPDSPLADSAVQRALDAFRVIDPDVDLRASDDIYDEVDIRSQVTSLDSVARMLTTPHRVRLLLRAGELWEQFVAYERARAAYAAAADGGAERDDALTAQACAAARLQALPSQWFELRPLTVVAPRDTVLLDTVFNEERPWRR